MPSRTDDERSSILRSRPANFVDRAGIAEIDRDIAIFKRRVDRIPDVALGDDVDLRVVPGQIENRLTHSTARSNQRNAHARFHFAFSKASSVLRRRVWFASVISQSGKRTSKDIAPRHASAVFTGTGFGSMNKSLSTGNILRCKLSADLKSPDSHARTSEQTSAGYKFDATLTTPTAPTAMNGRTNESSPLRIVNSFGKRRRSSPTRSTLPLASLIETMLRQFSASRTTVSGPISTTQRPGML